MRFRGSYNPHPFLFIAFPRSSLLKKMFLSQMFLLLFLACSCFLAYLHSFSSMFPCFCHDLPLCCCWPSLLRLGHVKVSCLCSDPHVFRLLSMFMFRSTCLCVLCHVFAWIYMFVLRSMSLCVDPCVYVLHAMLVCLDLCWLLCHVLL